MALVMTITDGTYTVNLAGTDAYCENFNLSMPAAEELTATDSYDIEFFGGTATVSANLQELNQIIDQARLYREKRTGTRVFLTVQLDGVNTYRSEVIQAKFQATPDMVNHEWGIGIRRGTLTIIRRNWWEGAEAQISLTNGNGTDNTAGLKVFNNGVGGGTSPNVTHNWFDILKAKIGGDLPAPIRLEMVFGTVGVEKTFIDVAMARGTIGAHYDCWDESLSSPFTSTGDANRTNDTYYSATSPTAGRGNDLASYFNVFDQPGAYHFYTMMAAGAAATIKVTPKLLNLVTNRAVSGRSQYINLTTVYQLFDLGLITFPSVDTPNLIAGTYQYLTLENTSGVSVRMDYLNSPRADQSRSLNGGPFSGYDLVDDGIEYGAAYYRVNGTSYSVLENVQGLGKQLFLYPTYNHRFYFNGYYGSASDTNAKLATWTVKVYYRPRFLSI